MKSNNKGFSLVELMVVVAIIAILTSFAVPTYTNFQIKARQKESQVLLAGFYNAAKATESEIGWFPGNFVANGFNPSGSIHYRVSVADGTNPPTGPNVDTCLNTIAATVCSSPLWVEVTTGAAFYANVVNTCTVSTSNTAFVACASANIRAGASTDVDTWSVTEAKVVSNTNDGTN